MTATQRYTLNASQRLKSRKAIDRLFGEGIAFSLFPLRVIYLYQAAGGPPGNDPVQCGFNVSARRFKRAVDRNRVKRLLREAWRLQQHELRNKAVEQNMQLDVFLIYTGNELPEYKKLFARTGAAIKRLIKEIDENTQAGI